jgi:hypothetical protein
MLTTRRRGVGDHDLAAADILQGHGVRAAAGVGGELCSQAAMVAAGSAPYIQAAASTSGRLTRLIFSNECSTTRAERLSPSKELCGD